jgi:MFS family permease
VSTAELPALWRNGDYLRYRVARLASNLGSQISGIAYPLLVLGLGGTIIQAGTVATCRLVVGTACKLPGGHLADGHSPRTLMIWMDIVRLAGVATIPLAAVAGVMSYPQLVAVAVLEGAASAVFGPAAIVSLRALVPPPQLTMALGQTQFGAAVVALLGPAAGGLLYGIDRMLPFTVDAASYLLSAALLLSVRLRRGAAPRRSDGQGITAGLRWLCRRSPVIRVVLFCGISNLVATTLTTAVILNLREHGTPAGTVGLVMTCGGCGALAGSLVASRLVRLGPARVFLASGLLWATGLVVFAAAFSTWVAGAVLALLFSLSPTAGILLAKVTRDEAPPELLGRASTAEQLITTGLTAAGPVLAGFLLAALGTPALWLLLAGLSAAAAAITIAPLYLGRRRAGAGPAGNAPVDRIAATTGPLP